VQLAKNLHNCHVIGVCSGPNAEFVQRLGADEIIDYERTNLVDALVKRQPNGIKYDLFIDCVGGVELFKHWVCSPVPNACMLKLMPLPA